MYFLLLLIINNLNYELKLLLRGIIINFINIFFLLLNITIIIILLCIIINIIFM